MEQDLMVERKKNSKMTIWNCTVVEFECRVQSMEKYLRFHSLVSMNLLNSEIE